MPDITVNPADVTFTARVSDEDTHLTVRTEAHGIELDRRDMVGYGVTSQRNAKRLIAAIEAGDVFHNLVVRTDVNGNTYLQASSHVYARTMNADLKKIGY